MDKTTWVQVTEKEYDEKDYVYDKNGELVSGEDGRPLKKVGIMYGLGEDDPTIFRLNTKEECDCIAVFSKEYYTLHKKDCYLNLPGGDLNYPMQVEFVFRDKDTYPELQKAYEFFRDLRGASDPFDYVCFLVWIDAEEARKYQLIPKVPELKVF